LEHIVVAGDTLSNISRTYGVPMDDIIAANNIPNPNALDIGQIIYIPVGGAEEPTPVPPTDEPVTAVTITPIPTVPPLTGDINVQIGEVIGVGQLAEEAVQIINRGSGELDLTNWQIRDESGQTYTFGNVKIFGGGAGILLHTETGTDTTSNYYWQLESPVWQSGEKVTLLDADGVEQASYIIP
jgi:LysM repeat protein